MHRPAPLPAVPTILIELAWPIQLDERPIQSPEIDASTLEVGRTGKLQSPRYPSPPLVSAPRDALQLGCRVRFWTFCQEDLLSFDGESAHAIFFLCLDGLFLPPSFSASPSSTPSSIPPPCSMLPDRGLSRLSSGFHRGDQCLTSFDSSSRFSNFPLTSHPSDFGQPLLCK
jgi:hypothetical protein